MPNQISPKNSNKDLTGDLNGDLKSVYMNLNHLFKFLNPQSEKIEEKKEEEKENDKKEEKKEEEKEEKNSNSNSEENLNHVLVGYFSKIFSHLINSSKGNQIINYIFKEKEEVLQNLINNCNRKSICDIIIKILQHNDNENEEKQKILEQKKNRIYIKNYK